MVLAGAALAQAGDADSITVDFNRDVRPIFSENCFQCHGPDESQREADLRLDVRGGILAEPDGRRIVVPGKPAESELLRRISAEDEDERMPPVDSNLRLSERQIELIRAWIEQGAKWQEHWSFVPPVRPPLPRIRHEAGANNPIDYFIRRRLEDESLAPSPEADKATLIRRVTLDLTGLPPSPEEVEAFLADDSPNAYEKLVDRLLASPRYGERMAVVWLDAARYADTSGYQNDGSRDMWRWRDWVIEAYNRNMPFDQFTIEQIAGDMLPDPTLEQRIATGFNRNHRGNSEGGVIPEEFQVEYVVDRVETTATVWLGLTLGCARCHEHKYDPISQKEFYQVFAYFNNVPEYGRAIKEGNSPPLIKAPMPRQQRQLATLEQELAAAERRFQGQEPQLAAAQAAWEQSLKSTDTIQWSLVDGLLAHYPLDGNPEGNSEQAGSPSFRDGDPAFAQGRLGGAAEFDGNRFLDAGDIANFGYFDKFSLAAWIYPRGLTGGTILSRMTDVEQADGYYIQLVNGHIQVNLVKRWLDDCIRVETQRPVPPDSWTHVAVTYDGSRLAKGIAVYVNGEPAELKVHLDFINQSFAAKEPLRIGGGGGPDGRFHGLIDDLRIYDRCLSPNEAATVSVAESITEIASIASGLRTAPQAQKLRAYFVANHAPADIRRAREELFAVRREHERLVESLPTVMVMEELAAPRETHILVRGRYDKPAEKVVPGLPAVFPPLPQGAPNDRLGFAQWLADASNPLTARVAANRYWQMYFGDGPVKTAEDFGSQGERPGNGELLDWLATEFAGGGWDVKAMQRQIVTSATYRQSSKVAPELLARDPENRLLARGPRFRLPAEMVRDQALAAGGLLVERLGGPPVKPYQPGDLWKDIATDSNYVQDHGAKLYRRGMYTFWKRTVTPPAMAAFDASGREMCKVSCSRTNTPLQALTLMNDVTFVEAARALAQRVMIEGGQSPDQRLALAFRLVLARPPGPIELQILRDSLDQHRFEFREDLQAAQQLVSAGEHPRDESLDVVELAAYTSVASLILNLDEAVTKQ